MVKLEARTPLDDMEPLKIGTVTLTEAGLGVLTSVAPYRGKDKALSAALKSAHGMAAPGPNRTTGRDGARAIWFGQRLILLAGPTPDPEFGKVRGAYRSIGCLGCCPTGRAGCGGCTGASHTDRSAALRLQARAHCTHRSPAHDGFDHQAG